MFNPLEVEITSVFRVSVGPAGFVLAFVYFGKVPESAVRSLSVHVELHLR